MNRIVKGWRIFLLLLVQPKFPENYNDACSTIQLNFPVKSSVVAKLMPSNFPFRKPSGNDGRKSLTGTSLLLIAPLLRLLQKLDLLEHAVKVALKEPV